MNTVNENGRIHTESCKTMKKILFASGLQKNIEALTDISGDLTPEKAGSVTRASEAGRLMESGEFSMLVVNPPLEDSQGIDLCVYVTEKLMYPSLLITNEVTYDRIRDEMASRNIFLLCRPIDRRSFSAALQAMENASGILERMRVKNQELQLQIEEFRLISRAKAYLIRDMGMTESRAHKFIEKQAMDLRITRAAVARNILKTYYNK